MSVTAIPLLSGAHARRDYASISSQIENTQSIPICYDSCFFRMAAIATPIYTIFTAMIH